MCASVDALRDSVLPGMLPVLPRVELAGCYRGADPPGGDWFDAFVTDAGLVAGVCGDVVGVGTAAAIACAELSTTLRVALLGGADPGSALTAVDRHAARRPHTRGASAAVLLLDPATGVLRHAGVGHPPVLLAPAAGGPRWLDGAGSAPLGLGGRVPAVRELVLGRGDAVLACTDGLLRTAGQPLDDGLARLRAAAARADDVSALVAAAAAVRPARPYDDAALLGIGMRSAPVLPVVLDLPADAAVLAGMRDQLTDWLAGLDVTAECVTAVPLVASELVSNAIEHAYAGRDPGHVRITAELDGRGAVRLAVADDGRWRAAGPRREGYGLVVARELSTALDVRSGDGGTTVTALCDVRRRASVATDAPAPAVAPLPPDVVVREGDPPAVAVHGVLDGLAAAALHAAVLRAGGGTRPVLLDLSATTLLAGAGVRLLHDLVDAGAVLRAPAGCPVATVLTLAGLPALG